MAYQRKTADVFEVQGYYGPQYGWECVCSEENRIDARARLKEYRENESAPFRIVKKREKILGV